MVVLVPERSIAQRQEALLKANEVRIGRAQLKRSVKAGMIKAQMLLIDPPEYVETMKVYELLLSVPFYGRVKVGKILNDCRISTTKTVGGLTSRQRMALVTRMGA